MVRTRNLIFIQVDDDVYARYTQPCQRCVCHWELIMKKISLLFLHLFILSACQPPSGDASHATATLPPPSETSTVVFTATPSQTPTPEPTPTLTPAEKLDNQLQASGLFPNHTPDNPAYTIGLDADGNLAAFDPDGNKIYEPNTNRWNSNLIAGIVENSLKITGDCEKTGFPASTNIMDEDFREWKTNLLRRIIPSGSDQIKYHLNFYSFKSVVGNCWGLFMGMPEQPNDITHSHIFHWPDEGGEIQSVRLFNSNPGE
jgi:hypothetical protein